MGVVVSGGYFQTHLFPTAPGRDEWKGPLSRRKEKLPEARKAFFGWEGSCCTTETLWEPSPEIWLAEKVRRGDPNPLACSPPGP